MSVVRLLAPLPVLLALAGCSLGPEYKKPALDIPPAFRATAASAARVWPSPQWWKGFGSPVLNQLIADAIAHNQDLAAAAARIVQADAAARIAGSPLLPTIQAAGSTSYERAGFNKQGFDLRNHALQLDVAYELDFWGKNRALFQAAKAAALGSRFDQQTVALTVVTSVATTWLTALGLQDELHVAEQNLASAERVLNAYQGRLSVGTASALDVAQQQALVDALRTAIPNLRNQIQQQVIALGILTGRPPEEISIPAGTLEDMPAPVVAAGLPSQLLERRPDVAFAEAQIISQNGNVRAARAAFFPQFTLTGAAGFQSVALSNLFSPSGAIASIAGSVVQTVFDNGLLQGQYEQQKGRYAELVADYRKAVLQAFTDVENALTALQYLTEQEAEERRAVASAQRAAEIARAQMQAGTIDIITVLNVQTTLYNDLTALAQVRLARFQALIQLYKALGGGWTLPAGAMQGT